MKKLVFYCGITTIIAVLQLGLGACDFSGNAENGKKDLNSVSIMTWNVQALFDGVDNGNEYDEYLMSAGWSKEKYKGRISVISKAIGEMDIKPDIIAFQEIESALVVKDLAASLANHGFVWTHFSNCQDMSLGIGILSSFPLMETKAHTISLNGNVSPRPILEVRINAQKPKQKNDEPDARPLVLFICHWKSKLGGEALTEEARRASVRIILRRMRELAEQEPDLPLIVLGDLNENHDEFYRRNGEAICALLPDDPHSAELTGFYMIGENDAALCAELQKDFFIISKNKPPLARYFPGETIVLYSPWINDMENGSYYYKNAWETIDHFLLSPQLFSGSNWDFENCVVVNYPPFAGSTGKPVTYNPRTGYGTSDHLPLMLFLKWKINAIAD